MFHPRYIAADHIVRYVRAMQNSLGSNVETLYKLVGNRVGPLGSYANFSALSKIILSLDMLFGRLEIFPMLLLFRLSTWRKH